MFKEKLKIPALVLISVAPVIVGVLLYFGPMTMSILNWKVFGYSVTLGARLDIISASMTLMISFITYVIASYSVSYLAYEKRTREYFINLYFTSFAACFMVLSADLFFSVFFWFMTSLGLNKLLLFFDGRSNAALAAKKKFIVSRFGDLFLLLGVAMCWAEFGGAEYERLFSLSNQLTALDGSVTKMELIFSLIALGALIKTVQFPFHFWLPETMEAPSVVSALMHAGIVNAGGILLVRLAPVYAHLSESNALIVMVGTITAVFGALTMSVQNDIKKKLAYSTVSQMGIMMLACGLGLYSVALFHIFVHSFYKAFAFLTTGSIIEESRSTQTLKGSQGIAGLALKIGILVGGLFFGFIQAHGTNVGYWLYFSIICAGLFDIELYQAIRNMKLVDAAIFLGKVGLCIAVVAVIEHAVTVEILGEHILQRLDRLNLDVFDYTASLFAIIVFALGFISHFILQNGAGIYQARLYYLLNGHSRLNQIVNSWFAKSSRSKEEGVSRLNRSQLNPLGGTNV